MYISNSKYCRFYLEKGGAITMSEQGSPLIFWYLIYLFPQFVTHSID